MRRCHAGHAVAFRRRLLEVCSSLRYGVLIAVQGEANAESENRVTVADRQSIEMDSVIAVKAGDLEIAVYNVGGEFYATNNICAHAQALLG
jgi:hypothetical protein